MKKIVLTMVALLMMSAAMAQNATCECKDNHKGHKGFSPEKRVEMLAKKLGLTDEQKAKIIALDKEMMADMKANKDVEEKNKKERFEKRMKKQKEMDKIEDCIGCGVCKTRCPYELDIPTLLRENLDDYRKVLRGERTV